MDPRGKHSLPVPLTPLLGRRAEVEAICGALLGGARLLTLTGPPGVGKTRLALEAATHLHPRLPEGACFVPLAGVPAAEGLTGAVLQALGARDEGALDPEEHLRRFLRSAELLLLLDNLEHLPRASGPIARLLASAPGLRVLATSRTPLHVSGEQEIPVAPLAVPDAEGPAPAEELARSPAVALFVERARAVRPDFRLDGRNADAVARICRRLDGIPLAIELAAARCKLLPPPALLERLGSRLALLRGGARDLPPRQRTLEEAIAWSYDLLSGAEQRLFARLAVFTGSWSARAAEAVCGDGTSDPEVLEGLLALIDHSLVQPAPGPGSEPRCSMLETLREYALARLEEQGSAAGEVRLRHARYFASLAEALAPALRGASERETLAALDAEHDNLHAALAWSLAGSHAELALRLCGSLWELWRIRGRLTEGRRWIEQALAMDPSPGPARASALCGAGVLARIQGDLPAAERRLSEAAEVARAAGAPAVRADALTNLGIVSVTLRDFAEAEARLREASALWSEAGDRWGIAFALNARAGLASLRGELDHARALRLEGAETARAAGDREGEARALIGLGEIARHQGEHATAQVHLRQALQAFRETGNVFHAAITLRKLAHSALHTGDLAPARDALRESLALYRRLDQRAGTAACAVGIACLRCAEGAWEPAARLLGAAELGLEGTVGVLQPADQADRDRVIDALRAAMGPEAFERARARGRATPLEALLEEVERAGGGLEAAPDPAGAGPLTSREREVLRLLAEGLSYAAIGKRLFISPRTVDAHLRSVYRKLEVRSRHEAVHRARELRLL